MNCEILLKEFENFIYFLGILLDNPEGLNQG